MKVNITILMIFFLSVGTFASDKDIILCPRRCDPPPIIDGYLSGWFNRPLPGTEIVKDQTENFGGEYWLGWDNQYLYFAADIIDDAFQAVRKKDGSLAGDEIEIHIQQNKTKFTIKLFPGNFKGKGDKELIRPTGLFFVPKQKGVKLETAAVATEDGYAIEARIPWKLFSVTSPSIGSKININIFFHDSDKNSFNKSTVSLRKEKTYAPLVLADPKGRFSDAEGDESKN